MKLFRRTAIPETVIDVLVTSKSGRNLLAKHRISLYDTTHEAVYRIVQGALAKETGEKIGEESVVPIKTRKQRTTKLKVAA